MKKISVLLVIIWMILIFTFSNYNGTESLKQSDGLLVRIASIFNYDKDIEVYSNLFRKTAHVVEYFVLGILVINACHKNNLSNIVILSILICVLYATVDEIHQIFIPFRNGTIYDALLDSASSLVGILIYKFRK